jgi:hypothetical protein
VVSTRPPLAICGDYFQGGPGTSIGSFGAAVRSAIAAAAAALTPLSPPPPLPSPPSSSPADPKAPVVTATPVIPSPTATSAAAVGDPRDGQICRLQNNRSRRKRVLIVGGGLTGALTAEHLLRQFARSSSCAADGEQKRSPGPADRARRAQLTAHAAPY